MRQLDEVMTKEVTRKEFLATLGFGVASLFGLSGIIKFLFGKGTSSQHSKLGYGNGSYGGGRNKA